MNPPSWLPALFVLDGVWEKNLYNLFMIFKTDFIDQQPEVDGIPVWHDRRVLEGVLPEGFWHVITKEDKSSKERYPDFRRAERLPWCGPSLNNSNDPIIKKWDIFEEGEMRTYVWLVEFDYVIILKQRNQRIGPVRFLKTAYYVSGSSTKNKLMDKYSRRIL